MPRNLPRNNQRPTSDEHGWGMLIFESLSAGAVAVLLALVAVLLLVGVYDYCIWPLTHWDFANVNLKEFYRWSKYSLLMIFVVGSAAGFWCFSGAAFREKLSPRRKIAARTR